ncbi:hypothetical protein ANAPC1_00643 [Anaplasma phagocytophilum]|uniref:Uncharacterized protein n=1 Tax=Anaplasma phagocytophilum TaxID=948 RepID=A0AA45USX6_ANAPH|nr:hypothetical protein ANAPC1_00643 [Anaplasma phagocytophilum]
MCICLVRAFLFSIFLRFYVVRKYIFLLIAYWWKIFLVRDFVSLFTRYYKLKDWMDFESKVIDCVYSCPYIMG